MVGYSRMNGLEVTIVVKFVDIVICRPFLGNELANAFQRRCDSWAQTIAGY
jgi:hypothetical protein